MFRRERLVMRMAAAAVPPDVDGRRGDGPNRDLVEKAPPLSIPIDSVGGDRVIRRTRRRG